MNLRIFLSLLFLSNFSLANYKYEVILDDLDDAWSMVFLDENTILYTELPGNLKIANLVDKTITKSPLLPKPSNCLENRFSYPKSLEIQVITEVSELRDNEL